MKPRCAAHVTPKIGERRPCAFHAMEGSEFCHKHTAQAARIEATRRQREAEDRYADAMIRRDKAGPFRNRPDLDRSPDSRSY